MLQRGRSKCFLREFFSGQPGDKEVGVCGSLIKKKGTKPGGRRKNSGVCGGGILEEGGNEGGRKDLIRILRRWGTGQRFQKKIFGKSVSW